MWYELAAIIDAMVTRPREPSTGGAGNITIALDPQQSITGNMYRPVPRTSVVSWAFGIAICRLGKKGEGRALMRTRY